MIKALKWLAYWLCALLPKRNHAVVYGWPDGEDQSRAIEHALQDSTIQRVVMLLENPESATCMAGAKTIKVRKSSLRGFLWFATAKVAFFSHPCFLRKFPDHMVSINMWHGMPIKKIGVMIEDDEPIDCSLTLATSAFWGNIMKRTIMPPSGETLCTGLPRNDRLFGDPEKVKRRLGLPTEQRLLIWLPTYRTSIQGLPRHDGVDYDNPFGMPDVNFEKLNAFLESHQAVMLVKPHPMAKPATSQSLSHLRIVDDFWLNERSLSLYQVLGASSALITDISSAMIDYLILDRPVIHTFADLDEYKSSRGFTVEPVEEFFAGALATDFPQLMTALEDELSGKDPHAGKRQKLRELSHTHFDNKATGRLLEAIGLASEN